MGGCLSTSKRKVTIVMVGLDNAGKTSAAKGLVGESPQDVAPTLGFSSFQLRHQNFEVTIYDLGGSKGIRGIWRNYLAEAFGFIFVVDASNTSRTEECQEVLHTLVKNPIVMGKPFLILANKQDVEGAMDEVDVCNLLDVEHLVNSAMSRTRVETCSALGNPSKKVDKAIQSGFRWLLTTIGLEYSALKLRVDQDVAIQQEMESQEKTKREERVRKLREEREKLESDENVLQDECDGEASLNCVQNPFKPISIVVKGLNSGSETDLSNKPSVEKETNVLENQNFSNDLSENETSALEKPAPAFQLESLIRSKGKKMVKDDSKESQTSFVETNRRQDISLFLNQQTDFALCPPGTVEEIVDRRLVKSPPNFSSTSQQSSMDVADSCDSLSPKHSKIDSREIVDEIGEVKSQTPAKRLKKRTFLRNHKTAPVQDQLVTSSASRELPPLILKPSHLIYPVPWADVTPNLSSLKTGGSMELDNMTR